MNDSLENAVSCDIQLRDNANYTFYMKISSSSYRFFTEIAEIACENTNEGVYINCNGGETFEIVAKDMTYDFGKEIVVVGGGWGASIAPLEIDTSFLSLFKNKFQSMITIIIVVCVVIAAVVAAIVVLKLLYSYCKKKGEAPRYVVPSSSA
jgi:hypothetical protein